MIFTSFSKNRTGFQVITGDLSAFACRGESLTWLPACRALPAFVHGGDDMALALTTPNPTGAAS